VRVRARVSNEIAHQLEDARDRRFGSTRFRLIQRDRVVEGDLGNVRRVTDASGADQMTIELGGVRRVEGNPMRAGTSGRSADDLVELGMRALILGEALPESVGTLDFMTDPGIDSDDLRQAFDQPNETVEAIARLVVVDGLLGRGNANRLTEFRLGPRVGDHRRVAIEWEEPRTYADVEPKRRRLEGDWTRP
jgi:hypothetical protein